MYSLPFTTLIIVVRNEISYIEKSLDSLLNQTYPKDLLEFIVVDGMSTDGTREWLREKVKKLQMKGINVKLLDNPKSILSSGWNIGIKSAKGDIVCRIDAHSEICPDYIEKGVSELLKRENENVVCVGGVLENVGSGFFGKAIANLFSSKFGIGNSPFRTKLGKPKHTDTAVFGVYWEWIFDEVGYFDENLKRNQDIELHYRIREKGCKFVTHPEMKIKYYVRNTISGFIKKAFGDGYWIIYLQKSYLRHKIPLFFVLYLFSIPFTIWIFRAFHNLVYIYSLPLGLYMFLSIYFSLKDGKSYAKLILLILFPIFHLSYGLGSLEGIINKYILARNKTL